MPGPKKAIKRKPPLPEAKRNPAIPTRGFMQEMIREGVTDRETLITAAVKKLKVSRERASQVFRQIAKGRTTLPGVSKPSPDFSDSVIKVDELVEQEKLDPVAIVRAFIAGLEADDCIYDDVFREKVGISKTRWSEVRNLPELLEFQVEIQGSLRGVRNRRVWCNPKVRDRLLAIDGVRPIRPTSGG